jgi:transposase
MYHYYFMDNREKLLELYHRRSSAETAFSQIKGKFGDSLRKGLNQY